eukprot:CAMPEP_0119260064 /NCGR_PEP_ID=MMETSP1329-20130426/630_1 /TAXON_ID=114041 /ORGANISM="Genus nov. species nov., Strain RCC1024" /LENGTH=133 /DNA_ID=CAMNT_0007259479 /DNA_START=226 /DNA_END=624 /DNA_ORIENTATION=-
MSAVASAEASAPAPAPVVLTSAEPDDDGAAATTPAGANSTAAAGTSGAAAAAPDADEDCGFCVYMRAGPCGDVFTAWEDCVAEHRGEDFARLCVPATRELTECMQRHKDYYEMPEQMASGAEAGDDVAVAEAE